MTFILDAGALIALERGERPIWRRLKAVWFRGDTPVTHAGVLGQAWRGGPRQARLSQALKHMDVRAVDQDLGRAAGELLGAVGQSDVIDAAVALLAHDGDVIVTSDPHDLQPLALASGRRVELIRP